jgi:cytochrome c-type biogenesis protein CcmF
MALGVAFSGPYQVSVEKEAHPGETFAVGAYSVKLTDVHEKSSQSMAQLIAVLEVSKNGKVLGTIVPERRMYRGFEQPFAEVAVLPGLGDELFAVLLGLTEDGGASVKVNINPLVNWIWIGGTLLSLAPFLVLRYRRGKEKE